MISLVARRKAQHHVEYLMLQLIAPENIVLVVKNKCTIMEWKLNSEKVMASNDTDGNNTAIDLEREKMQPCLKNDKFRKGVSLYPPSRTHPVYMPTKPKRKVTRNENEHLLNDNA